MLVVACCDCGQDAEVPDGLRPDWRVRCPACYTAHRTAARGRTHADAVGVVAYRVRLPRPIADQLAAVAAIDGITIEAALARLAAWAVTAARQ